MFRTPFLLGGRAVVRRLTPAIKLRMRIAAKQIEKMRRRKKESEAERLFMVKIAEGRRRRRKIIAEALRRALYNKKEMESRLLQRYEANKEKAAEELKKLEKKAAAFVAVKTVNVPKPEKALNVNKKDLPRRDNTLRIKEEQEAERSFFQAITELRNKREKERLAAKEAQGSSEILKLDVEKSSGKAEDEAKFAEDKDTEPTLDSANTTTTETAKTTNGELLSATRNLPETRKRMGSKKISPKVVEEASTTVEETMDDSKVTLREPNRAFVAIDEVSQEVRQNLQKAEKVKTRTVTEPKKPQGKKRISGQPHGAQRETTKATVGITPSSLEFSRIGTVLSPPHPLGLTNFNEPPMISPIKTTVEVGSRRLPALSSFETPVIPMRPGPLDTIPNVTQTLHVPMGNFFQSNYPSKPNVERESTSTGLYRL